MAGELVEMWLRILDDAFEGDEEHSLLGNMANVDDAAWEQAAAGGGRTIRALFHHAACAAYAYDDAAFRGEPGRWDHWLSTAPAGRAAAIEWAREGYRRIRESVAALDEAEIESIRDTHWGGRRPTWKILLIMAEHCYYHAGEINHARALIQNTDRWPGQ
jgi:uncharacterized damage-inducible protein DinB